MMFYRRNLACVSLIEFTCYGRRSDSVAGRIYDKAIAHYIGSTWNRIGRERSIS